MDFRLAVADIAARYQLNPAQQLRLQSVAALDAEPLALKRNALAGIGILGAALGGLGVILWIAANWASLGRFGKFALLEVFVLVMCAGAIWRPQARLPLCLLSILGVGGLFAYFGQTYQTGADPWQLFAVWAALTLPLCLSVRHDVAWAPWALVAMTCISLWVDANTHGFFADIDSDPAIRLTGWFASWLLVVLLSPLLSRWTGAGIWSLRLSALLAATMVATSAGTGLFASVLPGQLWIGLMIMLGAATLFSQNRIFDIFVLSALALPINGLLIGLLIRALFYAKSSDIILSCLLVGVAAAVLLSLTVKLILTLARRNQQRAAA